MGGEATLEGVVEDQPSLTGPEARGHKHTT